MVTQQAAEMRLKTADAAAVKAADSKGAVLVPKINGLGDSCLSGGIVQRYWDRILQLATAEGSNTPKVRLKVLQLAEVVLRHGLVHPMSCVPLLVAMQGDAEPALYRLAARLLRNLHTSHPSFVVDRLHDGFSQVPICQTPPGCFAAAVKPPFFVPRTASATVALEMAADCRRSHRRVPAAPTYGKPLFEGSFFRRRVAGVRVPDGRRRLLRRRAPPLEQGRSRGGGSGRGRGSQQQHCCGRHGGQSTWGGRHVHAVQGQSCEPQPLPGRAHAPPRGHRTHRRSAAVHVRAPPLCPAKGRCPLRVVAENVEEL